MPTVYVIKLEEGVVSPVQCETIGWPNRDEFGAVMYDNSHFLSESEAKKALLQNLEAWRQITERDLEKAARRIESLKEELEKITTLIQSAVQEKKP